MKEKSKAITVAAQNAGAIASRAHRIQAEEAGRTIARAFLGKDGVHALLTDAHGTTIEIAEGKIALTVRQQQEAE